MMKKKEMIYTICSLHCGEEELCSMVCYKCVSTRICHGLMWIFDATKKQFKSRWNFKDVNSKAHHHK